MKQILVLGAGRSSLALIRYLLDNAGSAGWLVTVADISIEAANQKTNGHSCSRPTGMDVYDNDTRRKEISDADLIVSLLPPHLHILAARDCVEFGKHLVTASYTSPEIAALSSEASNKGILLLNEMGLDPGIDHMSAMRVIDKVHHSGGKVHSFRSYCGGLVTPEARTNPWEYKFTWNPRNVILAGKDGARFLKDNKLVEVPYQRLFLETEIITTDSFGSLEAYPNRDSLNYREAYGLKDISTMLRGTLRPPGYCAAWNLFVQMGMTNDTEIVKDSGKITYHQLTERLPGSEHPSEDIMKKILWTEIFDDKKIPLENATPAAILQELLERKWKMQDKDRDMVVMQHYFEYTSQDSSSHRSSSTMIVYGDDAVNTAMAKTVGLPLGIAARLILEGKIKAKGVCIPVMKEIYDPVLNELKTLKISFEEKEY